MISAQFGKPSVGLTCSAAFGPKGASGFSPSTRPSVGHKGGRQFVLKWGRYVKLTPERLEQVERLFVRHGGKAVFAARFFSVSRMLEALVAGISRMRWDTFLLYSALSGTVWATAVFLGGGIFC